MNTASNVPVSQVTVSPAVTSVPQATVSPVVTPVPVHLDQPLFYSSSFLPFMFGCWFVVYLVREIKK